MTLVNQVNPAAPRAPKTAAPTFKVFDRNDTSVLIILFEATGAKGASDDERLQIVGGVSVSRGNVPWQVNLGGVPIMCGGTIVAMDVSLLF